MGLLVYRDRRSGKELVGRIEFQRGKYARFEYDTAFVQRSLGKGELGISERLPLATTPYENDEIAPFFQGLLPEGAVLSELSSAYQVARNDYFSLIEKLGCESIGALTFISEEADSSMKSERYTPVSRSKLMSSLDNPVRLAAEVAFRTRLSLAGAQSKIAWFLPQGADPQTAQIEDWSEPLGTAPSSHIVKLARRGEEELALNEYACSVLSASCGFETTKAALLPDVPGAIVIERYDRQWVGEGNDRKLLRLHQEDFCQALGLTPSFKYQPGGIDASYIIYAADLLRDTVSNPAEARIEFAKRLTFHYAVGNADAHLKNSSLLYDEAWQSRRLAPMYDMTCIPLSGYSTRLPFDFGSHRMMEDVDAKDILAIAIDCDVDLSSFDNAVRKVIAGFDSPNTKGLDTNAQLMLERIVDNAKPRIAVLQQFLQG